ncbi:MAG: S8 family serine peptidase [Bdellovibrionales bacterium]|nr:S8 family serine peptidase [Bdellovibrionales bacterium]
MRGIKVLLVILSVVAVGCTQSQKPLAPGQAVNPEDAIANEFVFMGDRAAVESELKAMGVRSTIDVTDAALSIYHVRYSGDKSYAEVASKIAPKVDVIEQNTKVNVLAVEKKVDWLQDNYFFYQWAFNNIGQSAPNGLPGRYDADMKVLQALQQYKDSLKEDVIVAVIDTGVNYKHKDLNANMWVNEKEAQKNGGVNGRDEDENGYTDDVHGYDFTSAGRTKPHYGKIGDEDPMDEHGHGSHCAGNIAAVGDNGEGISGVNPRAKIMALRALGNGGGSSADIQKAIAYATANGANIISASFGGGGKSDITEALIKKAGEAGILFVAAAGNDGKSMEIEGNQMYPATYPLDNILVVAASDNMDNPASFTNYGHNQTDVFAPGVAILSLYLDQSYVIMDGTSMATPLTAGVASLLMAAYPELKKDPVRVKEIIMASVDRKPSMYGKVASNGRVNALKALELANGGAAAAPVQWQQASVSVVERKYNTELVDIRKTIEQPGAKAMRVHFDFIELDRSFDSLYIYDKNFKLISEVQNGSTRDFWSPVIMGDKVIVRFVNAKVKENKSPIKIAQPTGELNNCLEAGGENLGPVPTADPTKPMTHFYCLQDNMEYTFEDLKKGIDDNDVFFSWKSEGFSVDQVEYTEQDI